MDSITKSSTYSDTYTLYGTTKTYIQIKSVISIVKHNYIIDLIGNYFYGNTGVKGPVMIETFPRTYWRFLMAGNTFIRNAGYIDANTVHLRSRLPNGKSITDTPSAGNTFCGGHLI